MTKKSIRIGYQIIHHIYVQVKRMDLRVLRTRHGKSLHKKRSHAIKDANETELEDETLSWAHHTALTPSRRLPRDSVPALQDRAPVRGSFHYCRT